jgi:hypothetical protein
MHDAGGPRWIGPVAGIALLALLGWGVATSASDDGPPTAAPVNSTTVASPTTTAHPVPTTIPPPPVPYYTADPPREFAIESAEIYPTDGGSGDFNYQLWAVPGSSASSGSWLAIEAYGGETVTENAVRRVVGDTSVAISHLPGGQTFVVAQARRGSSVTITSFGLSDDQVAQLAATITLDKGVITFADPALLGAHQLITTRPLGLTVQGMPAEQIYYRPAEGYDGIFIGIADQSSANGGDHRVDRRTAIDFYFQRPTPFEVDGHSAVAGITVGLYPQTVATWVDGDNVVTVIADLPIAQLIGIARTVRRVDESQWQGMQLQVQLNSRNANNPPFTPGENHPISFGTDGNGDRWTIEVVTGASFAGREQLSWYWSTTGIGAIADDQAHVRTAVDIRRTYVVADLPRAISATAELHVLRDGLDPVMVPFNDPDPAGDRTFAGYAFSEPVDYTAQIIGPDGAVIVSWPSS